MRTPQLLICLALLALPRFAGATEPPICCDLTLAPNNPLFDPHFAATPGPERPAVEPGFAADLPTAVTADPHQPPQHPRARGGETGLCSAPPETALGNWYKEGISYSDRRLAEPLRGRSAALPYSCY